jgi:glutamate transport system permease protein
MSAPQHTILFDAPGPKGLRNIRIFNVFGALLGLAVLGAVAWRFYQTGQFAADKWLTLVKWDSWRYYFLPGLWSTLKAAAVAVVGALAFGMIFGLGRLSRHRWIRWPSSIIVEFFRAVPVLLMMIFAYMALGHAFMANGVDADPAFISVVIGLTLYNGSVVAELVRSGVHSLPQGQREAAAAIGLRRGQSLMSVEVPQALLAMLPALISQLVVVLKDSALGYLITYSELVAEAKLLGTSSGAGNSLQTIAVAAVMFLIINYSLGKLAEYLGGRLRGRAPKFTDAAAEELPPSVSTVAELAVVDSAAESSDLDPAYYTRDGGGPIPEQDPIEDHVGPPPDPWHPDRTERAERRERPERPRHSE